MKFLAITLLAVCLIQGLNGQPQFGALSSLARSAASTVSNAASNAVSAATNAVNAASNTANNAAAIAQSVASQATAAAENAVSNAQSAAQEAVSSAQNSLSGLSSNAANVLSSATSGKINLNSIRESLSNLNPEELLETIINAETVVNNAIEKVQGNLDNAVEALATSAKARVANSTVHLNSDVANVVNKAAAAGIDVSSCAITSVTDVAANAVEKTSSCVTKKVGEAADLTAKIVKVPVRAATVTKDGVSAYRECQAKSGVSKAMCHSTKTLPAAVKAAKLVADTVSYAQKSVTLVATLKEQVAMCVAKQSAASALKAATVAKSTISCVQGKLSA